MMCAGGVCFPASRSLPLVLAPWGLPALAGTARRLPLRPIYCGDLLELVVILHDALPLVSPCCLKWLPSKHSTLTPVWLSHQNSPFIKCETATHPGWIWYQSSLVVAWTMTARSPTSWSTGSIDLELH